MTIQTRLIPLATTLVLLIVACSVSARQNPDSPAGAADPARTKAAATLSQVFDRLDANKDGKLALDEVPEQRRPLVERLMKQLDADGDKILTREELGNPPSPSRGGQKSPPAPPKPASPAAAGTETAPAAGSALLAALDKDHDGTLSPKRSVPPWSRFRHSTRTATAASPPTSSYPFRRQPSQRPEPATPRSPVSSRRPTRTATASSIATRFPSDSRTTSTSLTRTWTKDSIPRKSPGSPS